MLKGIAWDHPRGYEPLRACSSAFSELHPEVDIQWHVRSLKEFGDMPVEDLIQAYDLLTIDHPYIGQAHKKGLLVPLEQHLPQSDLERLANQSVGPSFGSYVWQDHVYALPIDAAALVAAFREDLIAELGISLPRDRKDIKTLYKNLPSGFSIVWPLCATDLWCTFLSLCAQDGGTEFIKDKSFDIALGATILDELKFHLEHLHPKSIHWNPIQVLDGMAADDAIVYAPFLFGYTNYSRQGFARKRIRFGNSPGNPKTPISTILGGVGMAVSKQSQHVAQAVAYARYVASAGIQEGLYTQHGGQPGNLVAWESAANNVLCHNFFDDTRSTMEKAYVRPRHPGWNHFQEQGAQLLHQALVKNQPSTGAMGDLNTLYRTLQYHEETL